MLVRPEIYSVMSSASRTNKNKSEGGNKARPVVQVQQTPEEKAAKQREDNDRRKKERVVKLQMAT